MHRIFLYLLTQRDVDVPVRQGYEQRAALLVRARSSVVARKLANERPIDEGHIWENPEWTSCRKIGEVTPGAPTKEEVVLQEDNAS